MAKRGGEKQSRKKASTKTATAAKKRPPARSAKTAAKKASAKKAPAKKAAAKKAAAKTAPAKKAAGKKAAAKKAPAKKAAAKKAAAKKAPAKKAPAKKAAPAKKPSAKKAPASAKKAPASAKKATPAKKAAANKAAANKAPASSKKPSSKKKSLAPAAPKSAPPTRERGSEVPPALVNAQPVPEGWGAHADAGLTSRQLTFLYNRLVEERKRKIDELNRHMEEALGDAGVMPDETDMAQRHTEQAYLIRFADKERKLLNEIEGALEKLRLREYGVCEGTEEPIGFKRLELRPWTRYSVAYKEQIERERSQHRR